MRIRNLRRYQGYAETRLASPEALLATAFPRGVISVMYNGAPIDFLVIDKGAPSTLVVFHSALRSKQRTVPAFSGISVAEEAGLNLIAIADPSVALGVDLAWYLGNRGQGPIRPVISRLVQHLLMSLKSERTILFGSSGGGYAAAYYAPDFPRSVALALNPRLDLSARPTAPVAEYLRVCHKAVSATPARRIRQEFIPDRVADTYEKQMEHYVAIIQNTGDLAFMLHQTNPFLAELSASGKVCVRYGDWGVGHTLVPKPVIIGVLKSLGDTSSDIPSALRTGGFSHPDGSDLDSQA